MNSPTRNQFEVSEPTPLWAHPTSFKTPLKSSLQQDVTPRARSAYLERQRTTVDFEGHPLISPRGLDIGESSFRGHRRMATELPWGNQLRGSLDSISMVLDAEASRPRRRMNMSADQKLNTSDSKLVFWQQNGPNRKQSTSPPPPNQSPLRALLANRSSQKSPATRKEQQKRMGTETPSTRPTTPRTPMSARMMSETESSRNFKRPPHARSKSLGDMLGEGLKPALFTSSENPLVTPSLTHVSERLAQSYRKNPTLHLRRHGLSTLVDPDQERPAQTIKSSQPVYHARKTSDITLWKAKQVLHREHVPRGESRFTVSNFSSSRRKVHKRPGFARQTIRSSSSSSNCSRKAWR